MSRISRPLLATIAVITGLTGAIAVSAPSRAAPSATLSASAGAPVALAGSAAPRLPAGAVRLGPVSAASMINVDVTLNVRDQAALTAFLAGLADRSSPLFHRFLRPGQFGPEFGPRLAQVAAVENALRSAGLSPGAVSSNRLIIPVTASAAAIDRAFGIQLVGYRMPGGRLAYANSAAPRLPAGIAPLVAGVVGLDNLYQQQTNLSWPSAPSAPSAASARLARGRIAQALSARATPDAAGPQACADASALNADGALTATQFAQYYGMAPLYSLGDLGQNVRVAIIEFEPNLSSDIATYESCYGISTSVTDVKVDGGSGTGAGSGEAALDIEDVAGLAPDAALDVYQAPNSSKGSLDDYTAIVKADKDAVISTSWGLCEDLTALSDAKSLETEFEQANTQGQTVFASAGDNGSTECLPNGQSDAGLVDAESPSTSPFVNAVGGTLIGQSSETVWNESAFDEGAGGGGISTFWCMPSYQDVTSIPNLVNADSMANSGCTGTKNHLVRQVPDVSADADPNSGYAVIAGGQWQPIGGTSAAAPLWAAIAALTDASPFCVDYGSGRAGVLPQGLYAAVGQDHGYIYPSSANQVPEVLFDITSGNNDYTPSGYSGGLYPAFTGFDEATGLGVPLVTGINGALKPSNFFPGLTALMCKVFSTKLTTVTVTSVSPKAGPAGHATTVTVHGTGFLPIAGANMALIGSSLIPASCPNTTTCTLTVPAKAAGTTINVQITAEDFAPSAITAADRFQYAAAPSLSSLSPARGPARGGNKVTIHGTNFIGVRSVHFGTKLAGGLKVLSATELTVTAPAGAGAVHVTVTAGGGTTSSTSPAGRYQYLPAPGVSSLSPAKGTHKGGNKVTIHGTNFTGVSAVHFGGKLATHVKVISPTEITVTAPAGTGAVHVTVTAAGGTSSASSSASKYTYT